MFAGSWHFSTVLAAFRPPFHPSNTGNGGHCYHDLPPWTKHLCIVSWTTKEESPYKGSMRRWVLGSIHHFRSSHQVETCFMLRFGRKSQGVKKVSKVRKKTPHLFGSCCNKLSGCGGLGMGGWTAPELLGSRSRQSRTLAALGAYLSPKL